MAVLFLAVTSCDRHPAGNPRDLAEIAGCWKGRQIARFDRPFSEQILFTLRKDSTLVLSLVYELGPRSRVWSPDGDVDVHGKTIRWEGHEGTLSVNNDSMRITITDAGGTSTWIYVREQTADSVMMLLRGNTREPYVYGVPEELNDGWHCADVSSSIGDPSGIIDLIKQITNGDHGDVHSFLIVKDRRLVVEEYFAENGSKRGPFITALFRSKVHHLASTTKSVTATLVGIAIDHGYIKSVEDPIYHYLPAYESLFSRGKKRIRIRDMLTMTAGLEWRQFGVSDDQNDGMHMWGAEDVIGYVLRKPLEAEPGEKFNYTNGVPTVTGAVLKNATGMEVQRFAEQYLFQPLAIPEFIWTSYPDGSVETDGGLALRSRDLAKIGQLVLDDGMWNGQRVVSDGWVAESTEERLRFGRFNRWGYGYHWMLAEWRIGERVMHSYFVPGDGSQILAVFPELAMVIVFTAGNYGKDPNMTYYSMFEEFILPAVTPAGTTKTIEQGTIGAFPGREEDELQSASPRR